MVVLDANQIKEWDAYTMMHEPVSSIMLMERAAGIAFEKIKQLVEDRLHSGILVLCGPGNNGGDGLVIARLLALQGRQVLVWMLKAERYTEDFTANLEKLRQTNASIKIISAVEDMQMDNDHVIIIDALFGVGLNRPLSGLASEMVAYVNVLTNKQVIAIDLPSGLNADGTLIGESNAIIADYTISFQCAKPCMMMPEASEYLGQWIIVDIGLHQSFLNSVQPYAYLISENAAFFSVPAYSGFAHKGNRKTCLLQASGEQYPGATILAAGAALKSGVGLVTVANASEALKMLLLLHYPELVFAEKASPTSDPNGTLKHVAAWGMGFGWPPAAPELEQQLFESLKLFAGNLVLDAGGIRMLTGHKEWLLDRPAESFVVLTPHVGEFDAFAGKHFNHFERIEKAKQVAKEFNIVIVLKGKFTAVCTPGGMLYFNNSGNNGMAKGGSGDVLAGLLAGLLAQPMPPVQAVLLGVYLHGLAGDIAAMHLGTQSLQATDVINFIPSAWKQIDNNQIDK